MQWGCRKYKRYEFKVHDNEKLPLYNQYEAAEDIKPIICYHWIWVYITLKSRIIRDYWKVFHVWFKKYALNADGSLRVGMSTQPISISTSSIKYWWIYHKTSQTLLICDINITKTYYMLEEGVGDQLEIRRNAYNKTTTYFIYKYLFIIHV